MNPRKMLELVSQLSVLRMFPSDPGGRVGVAKIMLAMCDTTEHAQWLVQRMSELYNEWPGPVEFRAVYCSRFKPQDGVEAYTTDPRFIEQGFPIEERKPATPLLSAGTTPDPDFSRQLLRQTRESLEPKKLM